MPALTPAERKLRASLAAHTRWAKTPPAERRRTAARGHDALLARFAAEVDPDRRLSEADRETLARNAYTAHMKRLALKSSQARREAA